MSSTPERGEWEHHEVPLDNDGLCKSFATTDTAAITSFMDKYGFVVIQNVLSSEACDATMSEFWSGGMTGGNLKADPENSSTWHDFFQTAWADQGTAKGVIGNGPILSPQLLSNRQSAELHKAYAAVIGTEQLVVNHDRLGVMRPTLGVDLGDGEGPKDRPEWRVKDKWLHIDMNPVSASPDWPPQAGTELGHTAISTLADSGASIDFRKTFVGQGLVLLTDSAVEDGGFCCVPGSHNVCIEWARQHVTNNSVNGERNTAWNTIEVPRDDPLHGLVRKVPLRKGSLVIWSALLFHDNYPNQSHNWRAVQYVRMVHSQGTPYSPLYPDRDALDKDGKRLYPDGFTPTKLGAKLFGFEPWTAQLPKRDLSSAADTTEASKKSKPSLSQ